MKTPSPEQPDDGCSDTPTAGEQGSPECIAVLLTLARYAGGLKSGELAALANVPAGSLRAVLKGLRAVLKGLQSRGLVFRQLERAGSGLTATWYTRDHYLAQGGKP